MGRTCLERICSSSAARSVEISRVDCSSATVDCSCDDNDCRVALITKTPRKLELQKAHVISGRNSRLSWLDRRRFAAGGSRHGSGCGRQLLGQREVLTGQPISLALQATAVVLRGLELL